MNIKSILFESGDTLSQRTVRSGIWVVISQIANQGLRLIRTIILARLLIPEDFGLIGIAAISTSLMEVFSQTGFSQALVQKKEDIKEYLDTAWTVSIIRGFALFIILFLLSPFIAQFFKDPLATPVIQVMAVSLLLTGLTNVGTIYFIKELEFRKNILLQLSRTAAALVVSIPLAFILRNVWAIVFGSLAGSVAGVVLSYTIHPYRPKFIFNSSYAKELFGFGKYIFASSILMFLITRGDDAFVGKILGTAALGFYILAYRISNIPATQITNVISKVAFPAYSKLQDNLARLREAYLKILQIVVFLSFPAAGMIFILAPHFTKVLLGDKWIPAVPVMQALVLWGLIRSLGATTGPIFKGLGKPEILAKLQFAVLVLLVILIYPLSTRWGIFGTSLAVVFSTLIPNLVAFYLVIKNIGCDLRIFSKVIFLSFINTGFLILSIFIFNVYWYDLDMLGLILSIIIGLVSYLCIAYLLDKFFNYRPLAVITESIQSIK